VYSYPLKLQRFHQALAIFLALFFFSVIQIVLPQTAQGAENYQFVRTWGSYGTTDTMFNSPRGIAVDPSTNNILVSDTNNDRIQIFTATGGWITTWTTFGEGDSFNKPNGIAVDSSGNVFIVDRDNNRVLKFDSSGNYLDEWGTFGGSDGQFRDPHGLALDSAGNVYVADTNNSRVQKFDSSGTFLRKWSIGSGGTFRGIAVDGSGNVFTASAYKIKKFTSDGTLTTEWGSTGTGDGQLSRARGIAVDSTGNVYVADSSNDRIQKFSSSGTFITKWGTYGNGDGQFNDPRSLAVNSSDDVYVADKGNDRIEEFSLMSPGIFGDWDWFGAQPATGNFLGGDNKDDLLGFYGYKHDRTRIWGFRSDGVNLQLPQVMWDSGVGNWHGPATKVTAGDFDGDNKTDLIGFYSYGGAQSRAWFFKNNGSGFNNPVSWWDSGAGNWDGGATKLISGDFDGDNKTDFIGFYSYGGAQSRAWFFKNNGSGFNNPVSWWDSGAGNWDGGATKIVAGDFNADGALDMLGLYTYSGSQSKTWVFANGGGHFNSPQINWNSGPGNWNGNLATISAGDFDGDGRISSLASFYDYGNKITGVWTMGPTEGGSASSNSWYRQH